MGVYNYRYPHTHKLNNIKITLYDASPPNCPLVWVLNGKIITQKIHFVNPPKMNTFNFKVNRPVNEVQI